MRRLMLKVWVRIHFANAYLAYHRGEKLLAAEHENAMYRYEGELARLELQERFL
jgi:hypothetical protein